ncbi:hypothetical protein KVG91_22525 [Pseudomonas sp. SWRI103]|uniref:Dermonecrotic toxin N-terminal domain-containing protein n=1 Tax=Pseudomonas azadiae TaxID=2843612 RepID=A0ABS6P4F9_9PSED|nr:hypothetical protein [Pseudomonas azadiae]NMF43641.1 hypothetical protein [Pseudomonas sp. SWRI 103]
MPADSPARQVADQFATRPTLRSVVAKLLDDTLNHQFPSLNFNSANTSLAVPNGTTPLQYRLTPLLDLALEHLAGSAELEVPSDAKWVTSDSGTSLRVADVTGNSADLLDKHFTELAIRSLRPNLKAAYAEALSHYWGQDTFTATSRWGWLSDTLNDTLRIGGLKQPGLNALQRETLDQITRYPDATERHRVSGESAAQVFIVDTHLKQGGQTSTFLSPDLLITRKIEGHTQVLHATAAGAITPYASLQDFAAGWERQLRQSFKFDHLTWKRRAPGGNIFDTQAAVILDRQLQNLEAIQLPAKSSVSDLEQLFSQASDAAVWFNSASTLPADQQLRLQRNMPQWLTTASAAEQFTYRRLTLALASSVQRNHGRTFLTDIPDIRTYAEQQLNAQLAPKGYTANDLEITFKVPVGSLGSGYIEPVKMSLVDMALENLAGLPKGAMDIRLRGQPVTDPQLPQMLKDLISQVDIGKHYPALLNQHLLSSTEATRGRAALFSEQVPLQLAMRAMELKLKGEAGITDKGYRFVEAVTRPGSGPREVDGQEVTMRPLAFLRKPGAAPDVVANMFLIEPQDAARGPHLLYRPQLSPSLQEFASREALLAAIQAPGPLQQSVLAWMPDANTRAVYGNGGFHTPHTARYGVFNEFDAPATPAPTTLALDGYDAAETLRKDLLDGKLMQHLFNTNAQSLVTLAEGQSTTDAQSRWASHKELGWLLFNTLLPVLRGPGAAVGWLTQLASVENDIRSASDPNTSDPTAAMVDLLVNVGTLLSQATPGRPPKRSVGNVPFAQRPEVSIPLQRPAGDTSQSPQVLVEQDTAVAAESLFNSDQPFDFSFSSPHGLSDTQHAYIDTFSVPAPSEAATPVRSGATEGLYLIDGKLHARVEGRWFRAASDLDGVFVIDGQNKARTGPPLKRGTQGRWKFDTSPKLRGGMPRSASRMRATVDRNKELSNAMLKNYADEVTTMRPAVIAMETADERVTETEEALHKSDKTLRTLWGLVNSSDRAASFAIQYQQELKKNQSLNQLLKIRFEEYQKHVDVMISHRKKAIQALTSDNPNMKFEVFKELRGTEYLAIAEVLRSLATDYLYIGDEFSHTSAGEPITKLIEQTQRNDPKAYNRLVETLADRVQRLERMIKASDAYATFLRQWKDESPASKKQAEAFIKETSQPPANQGFTARLERLSTLRELSIDRHMDTRSPEEAFFRMRFNQADLNTAALSHIELQEHEGYTADDRIAVLSNLIDKYQDELNNTQALQDIGPDSVRPYYGKRYIECLQEVITQAQAELADLVREQQQLPALVPARKNRAHKSNNKKVFKTRDKQTLVGTLRDKRTAQDIPVIDVIDTRTGQPLTSYSWHQTEKEWVQIVEARPIAPTPAPSTKPLSAYIADARKLMNEQAGIERSIQFQKKKLDDPTRRETVNPRDWSDMLEAQAHNLEQVAQQAHVNHGTSGETDALVETWRKAAKGMRERAIMHRCDGYLRQSPRAENIDYLWTHERVDIGLVTRGKLLKGGDYLTEYAIREKNGLNTLWYAHFHYPTPTTARSDYSTAHIKLPEQRFLTQKDLVEKAGRNNQHVDSIVRAKVEPPLDQKLFLKL